MLPPPAPSEPVELGFGTADEPEQATEPPENTIAASFANFGAAPPPDAGAPFDNTARDGADDRAINQPVDLFGVDLDSPEEIAMAEEPLPDAADPLAEGFAASTPEPASPQGHRRNGGSSL